MLLRWPWAFSVKHRRTFSLLETWKCANLLGENQNAQHWKKRTCLNALHSDVKIDSGKVNVCWILLTKNVPVITNIEFYTYWDSPIGPPFRIAGSASARCMGCVAQCLALPMHRVSWDFSGGLSGVGRFIVQWYLRLITVFTWIKHHTHISVFNTVVMECDVHYSGNHIET